MTEQQKPWAGLGYEPVPGLVNRLIARYLRGQRKNMERFFQERGLYESAERMRQIRLSRQGMMAKNRMFQEVLSEYAQRTTPQPISETGRVEDAPSEAGPVALSAEGRQGADGPRADAGGSVQELASEDRSGPVIEE